MKFCIKCNIEKELKEFAPRGEKLRNVCRKCSNEKRKQIVRIYPNLTSFTCLKCKTDLPIKNFNKNKRNPLGIVKICKGCRADNSVIYYNKNSKVIKEKTNKYYQDNKEKVREKRRIYQKERLKIDEKYKLTRNLRNRLYYALQKKEWKKNTHFYEYIGCSLEDLKLHIEKQFKDGMNWDNYGDWHIDHVIPLSKSDTEETLYKLCHYSNLTPEWANQNISKHDSIKYEVKIITAKDTHDLLLTVHYAKRIPSISYAFGLFANEKLVGVITYGKPSSPLVSKSLIEEPFTEKVYELNRLCLVNNLKNEASILIGKSLKMLPRGTVVLSFADKGQNHSGIVYQATNFKYFGATKEKKEIALKSDPTRHSLSIYDESRGKDNRIEYLKSKYKEDLYWRTRPSKHRYVFITGKNKNLYNFLKFKELPYPKD